MWRIYEQTSRYLTLIGKIRLTKTVSTINRTSINLILTKPYVVCYWKRQHTNYRAIIICTTNYAYKVFQMCSIDVKAHNCVYRKFPEHYVWNSQFKIWTKRKSSKVISRINIGKRITINVDVN